MDVERKEHSTRLSTSIFDDTNPEYQCCCGTMNVRLGSSLVAMFAMFGLGVNLVYRISMNNSSISGIVPLVVGSLAVFSLIVGLKTRAQQLLIPFLIVQALGIATVSALAILCFVSLVFGASSSEVSSQETFGSANTQSAQNNGAAISFTLALLLGELILQLWFMNIVLRCYCYFATLKQHLGTTNLPTDI